VKYLLAGNRILCEWLGQEYAPPNDNACDLKLSIPYSDGAYLVPVEIVGISWDKREYKFQLDKQYKFLQRRAYYRLLNPLISVRYKIHRGAFTPAMVADISGGGIGLIVGQMIKKDIVVDLEMVLPDGHVAYAIGKAVRVSSAKDVNGYLVGVSFIRISEANRDKIIKYIFNEQLLAKRDEDNNPEDFGS